MFIKQTYSVYALSALSLGLSIHFTSLTAHAQTAIPEDEIIVTGSALSATTHENLIGVSVLTGEELQRRISGSLGETLKYEPGISSSFFGVGSSRPIIRGQGGSRVLLLDNGVGSIDASAASPDHAASVEPAMANRIEVIRGSGLLRYGSSASGGVVNVIDGRIPEHAPEGPSETHVRIGLTSVDNGYETAVGSDVSLKHTPTYDVVAHAEIAHRKTEDYDIPSFARSDALRDLEPLHEDNTARDTLENSHTKATTTALGLSYISDNAFFGGALKDLNSTYGVPGGEGATIELEQTRVDFNSKFHLHTDLFEHISLSGGYADYQHKEIEPSGEVGTIFTNEGFETRAELVQRPFSGWQAAHGLHYKERDFSAIGEEAFVPPTTTQQIGIFSFHEMDFDTVHIEAAGRYEHTRHEDIANTKISFDGVSLSLGLDYSFTDTLKLGGTLARTERAPATEELFSNGPHLATNQFEIGDQSLGKETASNGEISLRYRRGRNHITLNGFYTSYDDYIFETPTGAIILTDEGDALAISQFLASDVVFKGFEIDMAQELGSWNTWDLYADASLEYVNATIQDTTDTPLPRIPPLGATLGINAQSGPWNARLELEHTARQNRISPVETQTSDYTLFNVFMTYNLSEKIGINLAVHNLTDQDARQHTSFLKDRVPLPGRNIKASLNIAF